MLKIICVLCGLNFVRNLRIDKERKVRKPIHPAVAIVVIVAVIVAAGIFIYRKSSPSAIRVQKVQDLIKNPNMQQAIREELKKKYDQTQ